MDDEEQNRDLLEAMLESLGYNSEAAESGPEALNKLNRRFDMVLLDVMMPHMDGFEVARLIRADPDFSDIPIIMVTGLAGKKDRLRAVEAGANDFISKPVDKVELRVRVASLLKMKEAQNARWESERRFRLLVETSKDLIWTINPELRFTYVSPAVTHILGCAADEIMAMNPLETLCPESGDRISDLFSEVAGPEEMGADIGFESHSVVFRRSRGDGSAVWLETTTTVLRDGGGRPIGILGVSRDITERKRAERVFIRETFGPHLSDEVVAEILKSPGPVNTDGELREISVLVCDLRDFTELTQSMDPRRVLKIVNRFLQRMTRVIMRHDGIINEFTGDGILVFFGAPLHVPDHQRRAVFCALEMQQAMDQLNAGNRVLDLPELAMGIGINSGELVVGNVGSERRRKYSALGHDINVAFRVESQASSGEILVTPAVYQGLPRELVVSSTRQVRLKGIRKPMTLYQVIGMQGM